jgi:hypothetical protein
VTGRPAAVPSWLVDCVARSPQERQACFTRFAGLGYRQQVTYHPAGSFWATQLHETVIYVGLALALAGLCAWWIRRLSR